LYVGTTIAAWACGPSSRTAVDYDRTVNFVNSHTFFMLLGHSSANTPTGSPWSALMPFAGDTELFRVLPYANSHVRPFTYSSPENGAARAHSFGSLPRRRIGIVIAF
jgi:hypothetical protein